jgi:initiation factor 1A
MSPQKKKQKKKSKGGYRPQQNSGFSRRTRYPAGAEVIGVVIRNLGARRMEVLCEDQVKRVARIPGRFRRGYRISINDVVLVEPWSDLSGDRGDISYRYRKNEIRPLARKYKKQLDALDVEIPRTIEYE